MSSLYTKRGIYYLQICHQGKRFSISLGTKSKQNAQKIRRDAELLILKKLISPPELKKRVSFTKLVEIYLESDHPWSKATRAMNTSILRNYLKKGLHGNMTTKAIYRGRINTVINWAFEHGYETDHRKLKGDIKGNPRLRVFSDFELNLLLNEIEPLLFLNFVKLAYFTGARQGELRQLRKDQIEESYISVTGKQGGRIVKLTRQAKEVIKQVINNTSSPCLFTTNGKRAPRYYAKDYVVSTFTTLRSPQ